MDYNNLPLWGQILVVVFVATIQGIAVLGAKRWKSRNGNEDDDGSDRETRLRTARDSAEQLQRLLDETKLRSDLQETLRVHRESLHNEMKANLGEMRQVFAAIELRLGNIERDIAVLSVQRHTRQPR